MARPTATDAYPALADYAHTTYPNAKVGAILVWNESSALASTDGIKAQWEKLGGTMALTEKMEIGSTDVSSQIARIKAAGPDVIFFVLFGADWATALKQARSSGLTAPVIGSDWSPQGHTAAGTSDEGYVYVTDPFDPTLGSPFVKLFVDSYKAKFNEDPEPFGASFYENTWFIAELVHRVVKAKKDPTVSQNLLDALTANPNAPHSMVCKPVKWDLTSHAELGKPQELNKVTGGKATTIALIEGATIKMGAQLTC
jgi:branched-chain amino acid transport system substrate-binding protein